MTSLRSQEQPDFLPGHSVTPVQSFRGKMFARTKGQLARWRTSVRPVPQRPSPLEVHAVTPFREDFESSSFPPAGWTLVNPNVGSVTWERALGVSGSGNGAGSAWMDFYDYELNPGDRDTLKSPVITGLAAADSLYFDCAYAEYDDPGFGPDSLAVLVSTNGGSTFSVAFLDGGSTLATAPPTSLPFTPSPSEWETQRISLPPGVAGSSVVVAFVAVNGYGNNLYMDNVLVGSLPADDIQAVSISTPLAGSKQRTSFQPQGNFKNVGTATQTGIDVRFQILNPSGSLLYNSASTISSLASGATTSVMFPVFAVPATPGTYTAKMIAQDAGDTNPLNDTTVVQFFRPANLSGTFTVGTGGALPTLKAAVDTLVANDVAGPLTFQLIHSIYNETGPLTIREVEGSGPGSVVTFAPFPGVSATVNIPGTSEEPYAIGILGSRYIVFDGNQGSGESATSSLTINATGGDGTVGVLIAGTPGHSSSNSSLKNLSIRTAADSTAGSSGFYGVLVVGADSAQRDSAVSISKCDISLHGQAGIAAQNTFGLVIDGCSIHDWTQVGGFTDLRGIWLSSYATNSTLSNNIISNIFNEVNGWWAYGIQQATGAGSNLLCINNMISGISSVGAGTDQNIAAGISVSGFLSSGDKYFHNSVRLYGNDASSSTTTRSAAFELPSPLPSGLKLRNNVFSNATTFNAAGTHAFALYTPSTTWPSSDTSNNNDLYAAGPQGAVGYFNGSARSGLPDWQSATGQDGASVSGDPSFVSSTNLHIATGSSIASNIGSPITGVVLDIDGEARNMGSPDIGADEFSSSHITIGVPLSSGWNMISNPVVRASGTDSVRQLYSSTLSPYAFYFSGAAGYQQAYTMQAGTGFWEKFPAVTTNYIGGDTRGVDSIAVQAGWNMVGSVSSAVDTSTIVSIPPGIRSSLWFGYSGGYSPSSQIVPGKAYWVKSSAPGVFILSGSKGE